MFPCMDWDTSSTSESETVHPPVYVFFVEQVLILAVLLHRSSFRVMCLWSLWGPTTRSRNTPEPLRMPTPKRRQGAGIRLLTSRLQTGASQRVRAQGHGDCPTGPSWDRKSGSTGQMPCAGCRRGSSSPWSGGQGGSRPAGSGCGGGRGRPALGCGHTAAAPPWLACRTGPRACVRMPLRSENGEAGAQPGGLGNIPSRCSSRWMANT